MRGYKRTGGSMADPRERLKVLINSMTPIVVIESAGEVRAVDLVCSAWADLSLPVFQWNIADGLSRCGNNPSVHEQAVVIGNTTACSWTDGLFPQRLSPSAMFHWNTGRLRSAQAEHTRSTARTSSTLSITTIGVIELIRTLRRSRGSAMLPPVRL